MAKAEEQEAVGLGSNGEWEDSSVMPLHFLKRPAHDRGKTIEIAEVLTLAGIKRNTITVKYQIKQSRQKNTGQQQKQQSGGPQRICNNNNNDKSDSNDDNKKNGL